MCQFIFEPLETKTTSPGPNDSSTPSEFVMINAPEMMVIISLTG